MANWDTGFIRNPDNTKKYAAGKMYIALIDAADTCGPYFRFEAIENTGIEQTTDSETIKDDSGSTWAKTSTVDEVKKTFTILGRDDRVRQMFQKTGENSVNGHRFRIVYAGAALKDSTGTAKGEVWAYKEGIFDLAFSYQVGNTGRYEGVEISFTANSGVAFEVPLPSGSDYGWTLTTTGVVSQGVGEYYYTADIA